MGITLLDSSTGEERSFNANTVSDLSSNFPSGLRVITHDGRVLHPNDPLQSSGLVACPQPEIRSMEDKEIDEGPDREELQAVLTVARETLGLPTEETPQKSGGRDDLRELLERIGGAGDRPDALLRMLIGGEVGILGGMGGMMGGREEEDDDRTDAEREAELEEHVPIPQEKIDQLVNEMGFDKDHAKRALWLGRMEPQRALEMLLGEEAALAAPLGKQHCASVYRANGVPIPRRQPAGGGGGNGNGEENGGGGDGDAVDEDEDGVPQNIQIHLQGIEELNQVMQMQGLEGLREGSDDGSDEQQLEGDVIMGEGLGMHIEHGLDDEDDDDDEEVDFFE